MSRYPGKSWGMLTAMTVVVLMIGVAPSILAAEIEAATETEATSTYMQSWEDKLGRRGGGGLDNMVIDIDVPGSAGEVSGVEEAQATEPVLIPLPPAVWSGLGGLLGLGVLGAIRRAGGRR